MGALIDNEYMNMDEVVAILVDLLAVRATESEGGSRRGKKLEI